MMKSTKQLVKCIVIACILLIVSNPKSVAQIEIVRAIHYEQITDFETALSIHDMKMSADGSVIVFATSGSEVKVYTIGTNGSNLNVVYDYETVGSGVWVDISADGNTVIWCDGYGEINVANSDGTGRQEIATLLPNPNPDFADITPTFPVPPRINNTGTRIFFLNSERDPLASGLWEIDTDGTNLKQVFNYIDFATDIFETDGSEYNYNTAYTDGFDISAYGDYVIFGTRIFQLQQGEGEKGDAIVYNADEFYYLSTYATGTQPFATYVDGDRYMLFRREENAQTGIEEVNLYALSLFGSAEIKIIEGLKQTSYPHRVQMTSSGTRGIVLAGGGVPYTPPITYVSSEPNYFIDLVNIDDVSISIDGSRFSEARLPSINSYANMFCFVSNVIPQIWVGRLKSSVAEDEPAIRNVLIEPTEVLYDGTSSTTIEAEVRTVHDSIHKVAVSAFKDGEYIFRAFTSDWPYSALVDDGTVGDKYADDYYYTNGTIRADLPTSPLGEYTVRIAAANSTLRQISAADFRPLSIVEELSDPADTGSTAIKYEFIDKKTVYPNPFTTEIQFEIQLEESVEVSIDIYDAMGRLIKTFPPADYNTGLNTITWDGTNSNGIIVSNGNYFCRIKVGEKIKMIRLIKY